MLKSIFTAILVAAFIFSATPQQAGAKDFYFGDSPATGCKCYVMSETIRHTNNGFDVRLKMVTNSGNVKYLDYSFWPDKSRPVKAQFRYEWCFSNSQGYSGTVSRDTPIEGRILEGIDYFEENG